MSQINARGRLADVLAEKIILQHLPAGRSVGEVRLAREMGVSRTPVREALLGLENEGLVRSSRGRGFVVQPLSESEAAEVYPIIAALERLAVEMSPPATEHLEGRLRSLNARMAEVGSPEERLRLDTDWHRLIVSGCGNSRLRRLIDSFKQTTLRYEFAFLKVSELRDRSTRQHDYIVDLLLRDSTAAASAIDEHWQEGMADVLRMLREGDDTCTN